MIAAVVVSLNAGCAVPLAPGYKITKEARTIHFLADSPPRIEIEASYTIQNAGTTPLPFVDIDFPAEAAFGRTDLRAELDGRQITLAPLPEEYRETHPNTLRITFDSPWPRGQKHQLDSQYTLSSPQDSGSRITISADAFHLGSQGWAALPRPPQHLLSPFPRRPDKMIYSVRVPSDFLVLARGKLVSRKRLGNEIEEFFQLSSANLAAYVVAGRYIETPFRASAGTVIFWTLHPLAASAGTAPQQIAAGWATLYNVFGPIDVIGPAFHIVESPGLQSRTGSESDSAVASFPGGALVNEETLSLGIASEEFVARVLHALAHNWFSDQMYPTGAAALAMREGLPEYATIVIDEASRGTAARQSRIRQYLRDYDAAAASRQETPLGVTVATDTPAQRAIALAKAPLMYAALEDTCGETPVRNGLKRLVTLLRGQEVGFDDMRSAVEETCGKDLGEFFRTWLYNKGVPADFRNRYEQVPNAPR